MTTLRLDYLATIKHIASTSHLEQQGNHAHFFKLTKSFRLQVGALFKFKLAAFLKSAHLLKEGAQYDSGHIFQVQFNPLFRVSALFQGGVGRATREDGVLLKLDFFEDKV